MNKYFCPIFLSLILFTTNTFSQKKDIPYKLSSDKSTYRIFPTHSRFHTHTFSAFVIDTAYTREYLQTLIKKGFGQSSHLPIVLDLDDNNIRLRQPTHTRVVLQPSVVTLKNGHLDSIFNYTLTHSTFNNAAGKREIRQTFNELVHYFRKKYVHHAIKKMKADKKVYGRICKMYNYINEQPPLILSWQYTNDKSTIELTVKSLIKNPDGTFYDKTQVNTP